MRRLLLSFLFGLAGFSALGAGDAPSPPNVLFIAVDDLNHWVTHLGRNPQAKTPNLDRLAKRGLTFSSAYCAVPACEPSRAALMSGQRPWKTGCYKNGDKWKTLIPVGHGLSAQFLKAGYYVGGAGKIFHSDAIHPKEWTEYLDPSTYSSHGVGVDKMEGFHAPLNHDLKDEDLGDWHIVNWCIERLKQEREGPFFIACGLHKPHLPFAVPRKYYEAFPLNEIQLPPYRADDLDDLPSAGVKMARPTGDHARFLRSGRWKAAIQSYLATCAYTDMNVGRLLDALDESGHGANTIVVLWGDHGWHFGEKHHWRKFALWEEATRAPLIWVVPGATTAGAVCQQPVDFMGIYPTLCELAGAPLPDHLDARSFAELLKNPKADWQVPAITTHGFGNHAVRKGNWRYIRYANGGEELYDHATDPYEWTNLANRSEHANLMRELASHLPRQQVQPPNRKQLK